MTYVRASELITEAVSRLTPTPTVLDIGCGIRPQNFVAACTRICCEPYGEYVERLRANPSLVVIQATWQQVVDVFPPESVDTVLLVDVIEHLDKEVGAELLAKTVQIARHQVVVFTPLGFMPQEHPDGKDAWGLGGGDWQRHRSGWLPEDFPGWDVVACEHFHEHDVHGTVLDPPAGAFWAILLKSRPPRSLALEWMQMRLHLRWWLSGTRARRLASRVYPDRLYLPA